MSTQLVELLILFAIAAFVLYRLKSVIGTRTGYEAPPENYTNGAAPEQREEMGPRPVPEPEATAEAGLPEQMREAVMAMREAEPSFNLDGFLEGARQAYEMVLIAYEEGDRSLLNDLLAPDVYRAFVGVIDEREAEGLTVEARFIGVRDVKVEAVAFDPDTSEADVTLRFTGELITAVRDRENRIVEG
ncbi:MAG: Tim44/TimA family putative adaptor protein, partial [Pseudomonadota bacterium]